jgi:hypothetical protein
MAKDDKWIQKAVKKPGALTATAKAKGGVKKGGGLKSEFLEKAADGKYGAKTAKRAQLAKTFRKMKK